MLADTGAGSESFKQACGRLRVAGLVVVLAAAVSMAGLAGASAASAATVVTHSAKSGELGGGRLTLHGVRGRVGYALSGGRSGTLSVRRLHRRLFLPGLPATGRLRVAEQRGGGDPRFKLSKPRYNAAQHTVSYRAKPLAKRRAAGLTALRDFGAAKLSIVPHQRLGSGDNGGNDCEMVLYNPLRNIEGVQLASSSKWDTDEWEPAPPTYKIFEGFGADWLSAGGLARGCSNTTTWNITSGDTGTFTFSVTWKWGDNGPSHSCTSSNPNYKCIEDDQSGTIDYVLCPASATPATCNATTPTARR
jgi:hypothetical protein